MYAETPTDIGNLSLDLLSAGTVTNIVNPTSPTEEMLARWYDLCRLRLLREHPWNFATTRKVLSVETSAAAPFGSHRNAFKLPGDFVRLLYVEDAYGQILSPERYSIEGGYIFASSDESGLNLVYIFDAQDVTKFDYLFLDLLIIDIAMSVSFKVAEGKSMVKLMADFRKQRELIAKSVDGQEKPPRVRQVSKLLQARRNVSSNINSHVVTFNG
jgi:hypothetical protein